LSIQNADSSKIAKLIKIFNATAGKGLPVLVFKRNQ